MGAERAGLTPLRAALQLGRVSNLPTVWSNVLAGAIIAGGRPAPGPLVLLLVAISLFYVAGMYLNDAFDREIDARERPERPIPAGVVPAPAVFVAGFAMMGVGLAALVPLGVEALLAGVALCGLIVLYDLFHKGNPLSPVVMGLCRAMVYVTAGVAVAAAPSPALWVAAAGLFCWVVGLSFAAKKETLADIGSVWPLLLLAAPLALVVPWLWQQPLAALFLAGTAAWTVVALSRVLNPGRRDVRWAVGALIAGISLIDATFMAAAGSAPGAILGVVAFALTLILQRRIAGT